VLRVRGGTSEEVLQFETAGVDQAMLAKGDESAAIWQEHGQ
jgi:hypothetical protein